jgi:hypothetical protein
MTGIKIVPQGGQRVSYFIEHEPCLVFHKRSEHIETCCHFIRESVENGQVVVEHVRTEDQMADIR